MQFGFGAPDIQKLKAKHNVMKLTKALNYEKDYETREAAAQALGEIGDQRAVEPLIAALGDIELAVRVHAAGALGQIRDPRAVEPLCSLLGQNWFGAIAAALGEIGDRRAIDPLLTALHRMETVDDFELKEAADALDALGWIPDDGEDGAAYWVVRGDWARCADIGTPAVEPLCSYVRSRVPDKKVLAIAALGEIGDPRAVESLAAALRFSDSAWDPNSRVASAAAKALAKIHTPAAVDALCASLEQEDRSNRAAAAGALGDIGDPRAVEALCTALADTASEEEWMRTPPGDERFKLGQGAQGPSALNNFASRRAAARALGQIRDPRAVERLCVALNDRLDSREPLYADDPRQIYTYNDVIRRAAAWALGEIGDPSAVDALCAALRDWSLDVNWEAAVALGKIGDPSAIEPLLRAALNENGDREPNPFYQLPDSESDHRVRVAAAHSLEKLGWSSNLGAAGEHSAVRSVASLAQQFPE